MTGPRWVLLALAAAFGVAAGCAALTTARQVHISSVTEHSTRI
jgi:hypothetical protein